MDKPRRSELSRSVLDADFNFHEYLIKNADKASNKPFHVTVSIH